jgi:hypothetical protein
MSLTPLITTVVPTLSEGAAESAVNPWFVGIGVFVFLAVLLIGLMMFGAGRDHS